MADLRLFNIALNDSDMVLLMQGKPLLPQRITVGSLREHLYPRLPMKICAYYFQKRQSWESCVFY